MKRARYDDQQATPLSVKMQAEQKAAAKRVFNRLVARELAPAFFCRRATPPQVAERWPKKHISVNAARVRTRSPAARL